MYDANPMTNMKFDRDCEREDSQSARDVVTTKRRKKKKNNTKKKQTVSVLV